jgi:hypothetical protein
MAQRINSKLRVLGDFLLERTSSAVVQAAGNRTDTTTIDAPGCPILSINGSNTGDTWSFLLGLYDQNGTVVLVNQDSNHPALATLELVGEPPLKELDPVHGTTVPALDDSPFLPGFQVSLLPGDARLFFV